MTDTGIALAPPPAALPVEQYLAELDALAASTPAPDPAMAALEAGTASVAVARRLLLEHYHVVKWTTAELPVLIANAPDVYSFTLDASAHYRHWADVFAVEAGYAGHPGHLRAVVEWCHQFGVDEAEIRAYVPLPETIAMTFTMLFHVRRSYEEGLAVWRHAGDGLAGRAAWTRIAGALGAHYGVTVTTGPATEAAGAATVLLRTVVTSAGAQARCRQAVRDVLATVACRSAALGRLVA